MKTISLIISSLLLAAAFARADDHGNTLATATTVTHPDTSGKLDSTTDEDWFRIVVSEPGYCWIYSTGNTDTSATLYNSTGNTISGTWIDDNDGDFYNFHMEGVLPTGTYFLKVKGGTTVANTGLYTLSVRLPENAVPFEHSNLVANLTVAGQFDLYRITILKSGYVWLYSTGGTDTSSYLYDVAGQIVGGQWIDDNDGEFYNFRSEGKLAAGTYFLRIKAGSHGPNLGSYTLSIRTPENAIAMDTPNRDCSLGVLGEIDLYRIYIARSGPLWIYSTGSTDTNAYLYSEAGSVVSGSMIDDESGSGNNFLLSDGVAPGIYYLRVEAGTRGSVIGSYGLHVRQAGTAIPLSVSGTTNHSVEIPGDMDLYTFNTTGGVVTFSSTGTTETWGGLYGASGSQVYVNGGGNFSITRTLAAGNYYLLVRGASLDLTSGAYKLVASFPAGTALASVSASASHPDVSGSGTVDVITNGTWAISGLPSWVTASASSGSGNSAITFTFAPNLSGYDRQSSITIAGNSFLLSQSAAGSESEAPQNPTLAIFPAVILAVQTSAGASYRIETSSDLIHWSDTGISFIGNGLEMSSAVERNQAKAYFRAAVN